MDELLAALPEDAAVQEVCIGAFWTAVVLERGGRRRCGLASTLRGEDHHHSGHHPVRDAGRLTERSALELAALIRSQSLMEASIGMAAINALLEVDEAACVELNAEEVIRERGAGKRVAVVGHFPFIPRLRKAVGQLWVLELHPGPGDLPAEAAPQVIPQADVVAITSTALINRTFERLITLCRSDAYVLLLGPSTPLSPLLFDHGVDLLSGTLVDDVDTVLRLVSQGATFRQIHRHGVRLVTMAREHKCDARRCDAPTMIWQRWLAAVRAFLNAMYGLQGEDEERFRKQIRALKGEPDLINEERSKERVDDHGRTSD